MKLTGHGPLPRQKRFVAVLIVTSTALFAWHRLAYGGDKLGFPDGYDAVQAAPDSHRVVFENALVRVLEVSLPSPGKIAPLHHHRWPSFFLTWDTGGKSPHVRYHRQDGSVTDNPSMEEPVHRGAWEVQWMKPEPMHAIEIVEAPVRPADAPSDLRIEIKCPL